MLGPRKLATALSIVAVLLGLLNVPALLAQEDPRDVCGNLYNSRSYLAAGECYRALNPPDYWWASDSYGWAGNAAYEHQDYVDALALYRLEIQYANLTADYRKKKAEGYYHAGQASYVLGSLGDAGDYYLQAATNYALVPDYVWASDSYGWAGNIAYRQRNYAGALGYYRSEIQYAVLTAESLRKAVAYHHAGQASYALGSLADARDYYLQAAAAYLESHEYRRVGDACEWAGNIASQQREFRQAIEFFVSAANNYLLAQNNRKVGDAYHKAGNAAKSAGDCDQALDFWDLAQDYYDLADWAYIKPSCVIPLPLLCSAGAITIADAPVTVSGAFQFRAQVSGNSVGLPRGDKLFVGASSVTPDGSQGTTGYAWQFGKPFSITLHPASLSVAPQLFVGIADFLAEMTDQWTLTFNNGSYSADSVTPAASTAEVIPFAKNVSMSGSGPRPTFTWDLPSGSGHDGVRVQIYDLQSRPAWCGADIVHTQSLPANTTSFIVPSVFSGGSGLEGGHRYSIEIGIAKTRGAGLPVTNENLVSISRAFFDFTTLPLDAPPRIYLPVQTGPSSCYSFQVTVADGQQIFIDPQLAIGYDYAIGGTDPKFASVTLPQGVGDNHYELWPFNGTDYVFQTALAGGQAFSFPSPGVDRFRVLGIETSAGIDPGNPTAFITGLTFHGDGEFTGTMTPVASFSDVPLGYWAKLYIDAIFRADYTAGYGGTTEFRSDIVVTREQMAAFVVRAKEGELPSNYCSTGVPFSDIESSAWSCGYVKRLYELGVTTGFGGTNQYRPELDVTRDQMAAFIIRAKEGEPPADYCATGSPFTDISPGDWSCRYIKRLYELGVTTGFGGTSEYKPLLLVTRDQMAAFLARAFLGMP